MFIVFSINVNLLFKKESDRHVVAGLIKLLQVYDSSWDLRLMSPCQWKKEAIQTLSHPAPSRLPLIARLHRWGIKWPVHSIKGIIFPLLCLETTWRWGIRIPEKQLKEKSVTTDITQISSYLLSRERFNLQSKSTKYFPVKRSLQQDLGIYFRTKEVPESWLDCKMQAFLKHRDKRQFMSNSSLKP